MSSAGDTALSTRLEVCDLKPTFSQVETWTCRLSAGESIGLAAPSGYGKTTLLRTIAGLIGSKSGETRLDNRTPQDWGWPAFRRQVIDVHQRPQLFGPTVEDDLRRVFRYRSAKDPLDLDAAASMFDALGLEDVSLSTPIATLSEGQQQRVSILRALLCRPRVLLLDEPSSSLDEASANRLADVLNAHRKRDGMAIIIASHDRPFLDRTCDRIEALD